MRLDKLTEKSQEVVQEAQRTVQERSHSQIDAEHLLMALLERGSLREKSLWWMRRGRSWCSGKGTFLKACVRRGKRLRYQVEFKHPRTSKAPHTALRHPKKWESEDTKPTASLPTVR